MNKWHIAELKAQLNSTDYKIIKCSECSLAGTELPYDIAALHAQRQAIRDEEQTPETQEKIAKLIEERTAKVAEIKQLYPYAE